MGKRKYILTVLELDKKEIVLSLNETVFLPFLDQLCNFCSFIESSVWPLKANTSCAQPFELTL